MKNSAAAEEDRKLEEVILKVLLGEMSEEEALKIYPTLEFGHF